MMTPASRTARCASFVLPTACYAPLASSRLQGCLDALLPLHNSPQWLTLVPTTCFGVLPPPAVHSPPPGSRKVWLFPPQQGTLTYPPPLQPAADPADGAEAAEEPLEVQGAVFTGELVHGVREGHGRYTWPHAAAAEGTEPGLAGAIGGCYEGGYAAGARQGTGSMTYPGGGRYEGAAAPVPSCLYRRLSRCHRAWRRVDYPVGQGFAVEG